MTTEADDTVHNRDPRPSEVDYTARTHFLYPYHQAGCTVRTRCPCPQVEACYIAHGRCPCPQAGARCIAHTRPYHREVGGGCRHRATARSTRLPTTRPATIKIASFCFADTTLCEIPPTVTTLCEIPPTVSAWSQDRLRIFLQSLNLNTSGMSVIFTAGSWGHIS